MAVEIKDYADPAKGQHLVTDGGGPCPNSAKVGVHEVPHPDDHSQTAICLCGLVIYYACWKDYPTGWLTERGSLEVDYMCKYLHQRRQYRS